MSNHGGNRILAIRQNTIPEHSPQRVVRVIVKKSNSLVDSPLNILI